MRCLLQRLKAALLLFDAAVESCAATVRSATMSNAAVLLIEALDVLFAALTADAVRNGALLFEAATMSNAALLLVEAVVLLFWSSHDFECR